jgi:hypothetical protein
VADFNPLSVDAQLATIIETLRLQNLGSALMHQENKKVQADILRESKATNGRVTALELRERYRMGWAAGISLAAAAAWSFIQKVF